jgi:phage terminase large subunit-like protein
MQRELFGLYYGRQFDGTGLIHKSLIHEIIPAMGTPRLAKDVIVWHSPGGDVKNVASFSMKAYAQGQHVLMGPSIDYGWIDEEPKDETIYPQVITRTATGNRKKGGYTSLTFTPENGMTQLVQQFMESRAPGQHLQTVTWDDAPHLDEATKEQLLSAYPPYQRDMRTKGIPLLGEGLVYPISEEKIKIDPFEIPGHYKRLAAIDFGFTHPTAVCWVAYDPDSDVIYVTDGYRESGEFPAVHATAINARGTWIPVIYPHDGDQQRGNGPTYCQIYRDSFVNLHSMFTNPDGTNYVQPGIVEIYQRMVTDRFKVFSTVKPFWDEVRKYHTKNGKIVKVDDDFLDACLDADTIVKTVEYGDARIADICGTTGHVLTANGEYSSYEWCGLTRTQCDTIQLTFNDGSTVVCTPDHKILTADGWIEAQYMLKQSALMAFHAEYSKVLNIGKHKDIGGLEKAFRCTEPSGRISTAQFLRGITSTILTAIKGIMTPVTLSALAPLSIYRGIRKGLYRIPLLRRLKNGTDQKRGEHGIDNIMKRIRISFTSERLAYASNAGAVLTGIIHKPSTSSVATSVNPHIGEHPGWTTSKGVVRSAGTDLSSTNTQRLQRVQSHAQKLKCVKVEAAGSRDVYCLSVPGPERFTVGNGVIVHNCRYAAISVQRFGETQSSAGRFDYSISSPGIKY